MISTQIDILKTKMKDFQNVSDEQIRRFRKLEEKLADTNKQKIALQKTSKENLHEFPRKERRKEIESQILADAGIIATTLSSCYSSPMVDVFKKGMLHFDCCIVDEATQCTEPETLIPLLLNVSNLVLVGDPQQLPATVTSKKANDNGLGRSLFGRLYDWCRTQPKTPRFYHFLDTQYRMHPDIIQWPFKYFYSKKVYTHDSVLHRKHPLKPYLVLGHDYNQSSQEECNHGEVTLVMGLVSTMANNIDCKDLKIGIITPYNQQKELFCNKIRTQKLSNVEVGTVDSFQGRERDVIVFSCTRTEGFGFMSNPERLNVALTRAKNTLIIIGNFKSLQNDQMWSALLSNAKSRGLFKHLKPSFTQDLLSLVMEPKSNQKSGCSLKD